MSEESDLSCLHELAAEAKKLRMQQNENAKRARVAKNEKEEIGGSLGVHAESSLEQILYDMTIFGAEAAEDQKDRILIAETLLKLPIEIRERVLSLEKVIFIVADGIDGTFFELSIREDYIGTLLSIGKIDLMKKSSSVRLSTLLKVDMKIPFILLNFANMRKQSKTTKMSMIAHEIAHFILGHSWKGGEESERMADDLVQEWGFRRAYRNYSAFHIQDSKEKKE